MVVRGRAHFGAPARKRDCDVERWISPRPQQAAGVTPPKRNAGLKGAKEMTQSGLLPLRQAVARCTCWRGQAALASSRYFPSSKPGLPVAGCIELIQNESLLAAPETEVTPSG